MNVDAFVVELYAIRHSIEQAYEISEKYSIKGPLLLWRTITFEDKTNVILATKAIADNLDFGEIKEAATKLALLEYYIAGIYTNADNDITTRSNMSIKTNAADKLKDEILPILRKIFQQVVIMRANMTQYLIEDKYH